MFASAFRGQSIAAIMGLMGFPEWTLWGMGLSAFGALIALAAAFAAQSPAFTKRFGLGGTQLALRIRTLTGYALALLLLAVGFFLAGVPLGVEVNEPAGALAESTQGVNSEESSTGSADSTSGQDESPAPATTRLTPATGAFAGPPLPEESPTVELSPTAAVTETVQFQLTTATPSTTPTASAAASALTSTGTASPTPTATATPTQTPTPSATPTPITGETALVNSGGSTIWLVRSPGGQNVQLVSDGERLILLPGRANHTGLLWREVSTVQGVVGWIQESLLGPDS
jgi:hypothetical protein